ncbi:MAG: FAD-binding protein [Microbacteriaceae bacterium]|nr:FAD-binding protein [Microbacteriaceae bacterium]
MTNLLQPGGHWSNWGRVESANPTNIARPTTVEEVVAVVHRARELNLPVKAVGAGHSFTAIAAAPGIQMDLAGLDGLLHVDAELRQVTLGAGTNLFQLPALLAPHGLAMENLGDIDRQTIAGATSTGTHGTGNAFTGIAAQLVAVTLVTGDGSVLRVNASENAELLPAVTLGLGALGIIVDVTVQCVPAFALHALERPERFDTVLDNYEGRVNSSDHFEFYWFPHTDTVLTKTNTRLPADTELSPIGPVKRWFDDTFMSNGVFALTCSTGNGLPATVPGINRLASKLTGDREFTDVSTSVFTTKRTVRFREMEYAIPRDAIPDAVRAVRALIDDRGWRISFPLEVRTAALDDLWLSTAQGRETGYIAVHRYWRENHLEYFHAVEDIMRGFDGRPHWGKIHFRHAESLAASYLHFSDFLAARDRLDPERVFGNPYLDRVLGA